MPMPKWVLPHLKRALPTLGVAVTAVVALGLVAGYWLGGGLATMPLAHAVIAVVSMLPVLLALAAVPLLVSRFLRDLYDLGTLDRGYALLNRLIFGPWSPKPYLLVKEGRLAGGEGTSLHKVGGPGYMVIYNDSAVITEKCGRLHRVLGPGSPRLERFEKVWQIVDLRPQRRVVSVTGMTREGIPVTCEVDVSFKIDDRVPNQWGHLQPKQPTEKEPYPYTTEAVFRAAISRRVKAPGEGEQDWGDRVAGAAGGTLRNILNEYRLDWLIAPTRADTEHPREAIRKRLEEKLRDAASGVGAKILRVHLGEFQVEDERIPRQWVEAWRAEWESRAMVSRAEGEAELLRMDTARVQAQAEMVIALTQALQSVVTSQAEVRPYLLAARFVEALRWMSYDPFTRAFMPPEALQTLKRLQDAIDTRQLLPGEGAGRGEGSEEAR